MRRLFFVLLNLLIIFNVNVYAQFSDDNKIPPVNVYISEIPEEEVLPENFTISVTYEIPEGYHIFLNKELFNIEINHKDFTPLADTIYPVDEAEELLGLPSFSGSVTLTRDFSYKGSLEKKSDELIVTANYQMCNDEGSCYMPVSLELSSSTGQSVNQRSNLQGSSISTILWYIFLAFAGGLLLNIMPCVLPLLSVKALNLVQQSNQDSRQIRYSSLLYGVGILFSFLLLAAIVIFFKSTGEVFGWGFQFQNPYFVLVLLTIIFIFSLSLFDVFTITPPQKTLGQASKYSIGKSYGSSFVTGVFAVFVATPCTAPFMGAALGFAFSQSPITIILIFSSLSIGFALPFILIGFKPALIKKIPKPGNWMNTFKEFMGFLLLGTAVYLLSSLHSLIGKEIKNVLWFLLFSGLAAWIYGKFATPVMPLKKRMAVFLSALLLMAGSAFLLIDFSNISLNKSYDDGIWQTFSPELVDTYRNSGKPVFIDFYADWCTSCKVNDATVLNTKTILSLFEEYDVQLLKGDFTAGDDTIAKWLAKYERGGVPLYLLFRPDENNAVVFPEFLTKSMVEKEIRKISK